MPKLPFSYEESTKTNVLLSGANASGKTRLTCSIASKLHKLGHVVKVVDVSGVWRNLSDLPLYVQPFTADNQITLPTVPKNQSVIYDLSTLKLSQVKTLVDKLCLKIWDERINKSDNKQTYLILEESETFLKNIRSKEAENLFRLVHVGRNIDVRCILITTDLALIDASVIRLCGLRFHGFLTPEENSKRKFRAYYGKDWLTVATEALEAGTFITFDQSNKKQPLKIKSYECFKPTSKPRRYYPPIKHTIKESQHPTIKEDTKHTFKEVNNKPSFWEVFKGVLFAPFSWLDCGGFSSLDYTGNRTRTKHSKAYELFNLDEDLDSEQEELDGALILEDC